MREERVIIFLECLLVFLGPIPLNKQSLLFLQRHDLGDHLGVNDVTLSTYFIRKLSMNSFLFVSWCTDHTY